MKKTCTAPGERAAELVRATTIRSEMKHRGLAAVALVKAASMEVLVSNPMVAGNGEARQPTPTASAPTAKPNRTQRVVPVTPTPASGNGDFSHDGRTGS